MVGFSWSRTLHQWLQNIPGLEMTLACLGLGWRCLHSSSLAPPLQRPSAVLRTLQLLLLPCFHLFSLFLFSSHLFSLLPLGWEPLKASSVCLCNLNTPHRPQGLAHSKCSNIFFLLFGMTESSFCTILFLYLLYVLCLSPLTHLYSPSPPASFPSKHPGLLLCMALAGCEGVGAPRGGESLSDLSCRERPKEVAQLSMSGLIPTDEK